VDDVNAAYRPPGAGDPTRFRVDDLIVDLGRQRVTRAGVDLKLPGLSFDLFVALVQAAPNVVAVPRLMDMVWPDAVVSPETISQRVKLLRSALGDDAHSARYVAGVRSRGYRIVATVTALSADTRSPDARLEGVMPARPPADAAREDGQSSPSADRGSNASARWPWIAAAVVAALVIGYPFAERPWSAKQLSVSGGETISAAEGIYKPSIAIMPFVDMSEKKDQEYFADGLTEDLINRLATVPQLHVPARTSSFYFKGKQATVPEIAKALGVAYLLEGSVSESGNTLRVTTQLVRVDNGYQAWSGSFDRPLTDLFKVQDKITGAVIQALKLSLVDHYTPRVGPTENIEAYTLYLRALSNITNNGSDDYDAAVEQLHAALSLDPQFVDAWASLSMAILYKGNTHGAPAIVACAAARAAATQALTLNARLEEGHRAAGLIFQYCDGNLPGAEAEFNRAIEVAPERDDALRSYAWLLVDAGRFNQALRLAQRAVDRDPLNAWNYVALGDSYWRSGRISEAEMAYQKAVQLNPTTVSLHALYANVLLSAHKPVAAVAEAEREPDPQYRQLTLPIALDAAGRKADADREVAAYESMHSEDDPGEIAVFYACRNDADQAIEWLGKFAAKHMGEFATLPNRIACFRNIESDSRYLSLLQQVRRETPTRPLTAKVRSFRHVDFYSKPNFAQSGFSD
jgi:TolB-like protein/DNA-binding winged helix-turn-helix (wHTH) protein/Tfp pilus assembly protein PilF